MDEIEDLKKMLKELKEQVSSKKDELSPIMNSLQEIDTKRQIANDKYIAEVNELRIAHEKADRELMDTRWDISSKVTPLQQYIDDLARNAAQIEERIRQWEFEQERLKAEAARIEAEKRQYNALSELFDKGTMGAPWREFAKDHQIQAGHKISLDQKVILADPMGLGKTLSSVITADMVEKATDLASPDFPFMGEEKEYTVMAKYVWSDDVIEMARNNKPPFDNDYPKVVDNGVLYYKDWTITPGEPIPYINYDTKMRLVELGVVTHIPAHKETKIINSITRPVGRKVLYFCPSPLLRNVLEEWRQWAPHRSVTYIGNMSKAERSFVLDITLPQLDEYVIIINYEAWRRDKALLDKLAACRFDTVVIDEAHNVKNMKSSAFKGVKQIVDSCKPEYVIPMTGTPILNRPQELFALLNIIEPEKFSHERDFLWAYCEEYTTDDSDVPKWKFKEGGLEALSKKISKNFMRRTKDQVGIELPEKSIIYHELDLDTEKYPEQSKAREHMKTYATIVLDEKEGKAIKATVMIALITRLRQIETWPAGIIQRDPVTKEPILKLDVEESQKIDYIIRKEDNEWEGLIPDTVEDERIVVFSQFKAPLQELKFRVEAAGYRAVVLDGSTPSHLRDQIRHDFDRKITPNREDSKWDVLLANYRAAGVGLNLTNATQLITLDEEWNPGKREQAWDRIHRIGQTENVTINVVRTKDTIDTWLANIIEQKEKITSGFESAMLNVDDLKNFLTGKDSGLA